jgi:hypothetical protein
MTGPKLDLPLNVRLSQDVGINLSAEDAPKLLEFINKTVRGEIAKIGPRVEAAIAQAALDAGVAERQRIIQWMREDDGAGMSAKEYADILAMGLPTNATESNE